MSGPQRRPSRAAAASLVAAVVTIAIDASTEASATAATAEAGLDAHVVDQTYAVPVDGTLAVTFELTGPISEVNALAAAPAATVTVSAHDAITSAADLDLAADERPPALDSVTLLARDVVSFADGRATGRVSIPLDADTPPSGGLRLADPAIYPLTIDVAACDAAVASAATFFQVLGEEDRFPPLSIAILAAVGDPAGPAADAAAAIGDDVDSLIALAEAVDAPLSISLPPSVITGITAIPGTLGPGDDPDVPVPTADTTVTSLPAAGPAAGRRLATAFRADELLAQPSVPLDPSALVAVGEADVFTGLLREGEDIASAASPRAALSRAVWVVEGPISGAGAAMLRDLGIRMLVVTDTTADELGVDAATMLFEVALGPAGTLPAVAVSPLGVRLQPQPAAADTGPTANERAVRLLAELQLAHGADGPSAVLLATPGVGLPDPAVTAQLAAFVDEVPDVAIVPLSRLPGIVDGALAGTTAAPVELPERAGADLTERIDRLDIIRTHANHAASMLADSHTAASWQSRLDRLLSSALDDATAVQHATVIESEIDAVLAAVVAPDPFTVTMTGTSNTLRLAVHNPSEMPLRVELRVRSPKLVIPERVQSAQIPALGSVEVEIPVEARSNGTFTIEVDVLAPDGYRLAPPVVLKARVSRITGLSQVVTGGAVLVLVSWWYSHLRRSHRRRQATGPVAAGDTITADVASAPGHGIDRPRPPSQ